MGHMATRRIEQTQESRRLIVTAAAELFAEKGYRQTSFIDIADKAGISRGSIPWHFGNKLGLLEAVLDEQLQVVRSGSHVEHVLDFIRAPTSRLFITLIGEAVEAGSPIREHYAQLHAALRQAVQARVPMAALPAGLDPEAVTVLLVGAVIGVHVQWRVFPEAVDLDAVEAAMRALLPLSVG